MTVNKGKLGRWGQGMGVHSKGEQDALANEMSASA